MKKLEICLLCCLCLLLLSGCKRYDRLGETPAPVVVTHPSAETAAADQEDADSREETDPQLPSIVELTTRPEELAPAVKVKGIYLTAYAAGNTSRMDEIIGQIDKTEINTVVIDVKDDSGRVTFAMDSPLVSEAGSVQNVMEIGPLMKKLKEHHIYTIARVVAFKDPYVTKTHPEWGLRLANGELYKDNSGQTWLNPYKEEVWDYLIEICVEAHKAGFDEVQFDYLRFSTEKNVKDVVYEDADTQGRDKKEVITQFVEHAYERLHSEGIYMAADVFGAIIGGGIDSDAVGQSYGNMANILDYICPMIYPSHYGDGNFGIEHPDMQPYDTILAALKGSAADLRSYAQEGEHQAIVRPWLQDFTASYLRHYIQYGPEQIREEIQAVYDAGYDEWLLWNASCRYHWDAMRTPAEAEAEAQQIARQREQERKAAESAEAAESEDKAAD